MREPRWEELEPGSPYAASVDVVLCLQRPKRRADLPAFWDQPVDLLSLDTAFRPARFFHPGGAFAGDNVVPNTFRVANRLDLVPKLPLPPLYYRVLGLFELNPVKFGIPPKVLVKCGIPCEQQLSFPAHSIS